MQAEKKFELIYYKYVKLVNFIISKYVENKLDVEELTNDVFIKYSQVFLNKEIKNVKQYLIAAAKNTAINFLKAANINIVYDDNIFINYQDENDNYGYIAVINELLQYLSYEETNIILLRLVYDYSFNEIAGKYNYTVAKTKAIYYRAKKKIIKNKRRIESL